MLNLSYLDNILIWLAIKNEIIFLPKNIKDQFLAVNKVNLNSLNSGIPNFNIKINLINFLEKYQNQT